MLSILTLAEMKTVLGVTDLSDDVALEDLMSALQARFDAHLNRTLLRGVDVEELFDGGGASLWVARYPIESVASVHVDADQGWDADSLLDSDDYRIDKRRGRIVFGVDGTTKWDAGVQNIRVVYTGGYVAAGAAAGSGQTAMDEAIRAAFRMQCSFEWRNKTHLGQASVSAQGFSVNLAPAKLLAEVEEILVPFKRY